jgi:hypothetical protein
MMEMLGAVCQEDTVMANQLLNNLQISLTIKPDSEPTVGERMVSLECAIHMVVPTLLSRFGTKKSKNTYVQIRIRTNSLQQIHQRTPIRSFQSTR